MCISDHTGLNMSRGQFLSIDALGAIIDNYRLITRVSFMMKRQNRIVSEIVAISALLLPDKESLSSLTEVSWYRVNAFLFPTCPLNGACPW